jgi:hypothetical protein
MRDDVKLLMELQDLDYWIDELERSKDYIPDMMKSLRNEMEELSTELDEKQERVKQAKVEAQNLELTIAKLKEQLEKYQEQMLTIKTNKEYDALVAQIESAKAEISENEETYITTLDEIETLDKNITELTEKCGTIEKENSERISSLQSEIDNVEDKMSEKVAYRQQLKSKVPRSILSIYQRVHKGRGGDVVVRLKRGACGACYKGQTPQKIQMIKNGDTIQTCDSCGRILVWDGDD